ncbi:MAG TPA: hypothetical protein ENH82_13710 [bacterium]|nr:hypothetical protein [bacterium]
MKQYRLYTENKNRKWLIREVSKHFKNFTTYKTVGFWEGEQEKSIVIEILSDHLIPAVKLSLLCKAICGYNRQQCVMITTSDCDMEFLS